MTGFFLTPSSSAELVVVSSPVTTDSSRSGWSLHKGRGKFIADSSRGAHIDMTVQPTEGDSNDHIQHHDLECGEPLTTRYGRRRRRPAALRKQARAASPHHPEQGPGRGGAAGGRRGGTTGGPPGSLGR